MVRRERGEAADFYCGIFPNSRRLDTVPAESKDPNFSSQPENECVDGGVRAGWAEVYRTERRADVQVHEAISLVVRCETQADVDYYWERLCEGGKPSQCGWLKDKFGLSWQITPVRLIELIRNPKAMQAMLRMGKIDIAEVERAAAE